MSNDGTSAETAGSETSMRRPAEYFDDVEVTLIHIAGTLRGALKVERLLTDHEVPYAVETDSYVGGLLFRTQRVGAFFYVSEGDADRARELLLSKKFKIHRE